MKVVELNKNAEDEAKRAITRQNAKAVAFIYKTMYDACLEEGFTPEQAMELTLYIVADDIDGFRS